MNGLEVGIVDIPASVVVFVGAEKIEAIMVVTQVKLGIGVSIVFLVIFCLYIYSPSFSLDLLGFYPDDGFDGSIVFTTWIPNDLNVFHVRGF